ncbi:MAG TPA: carboxypeptidase-like regulatory domain-containing protein, partial [Planctomycetota bacterium]|nr:carboxypeptidase-like regulatory domain-containing protein [Planctomycetota bacterium]
MVDAAGAPVADALVEQFGNYAVDRKSGDPKLVAVGKVFRRVVTTDADGRPQPPLFPNPAGESIQASSGGMSSDTWLESRTASRDPIELVVSPSFSSHGWVTSADSTLDLTGLVVDALAYHGKYTGSLATANVRADGSWGPIPVPYRRGWEYSLILAGPRVARDRAVLGNPSPGDQIRRDFQAVAELVLPVSVSNDEGEPVAEATCTVLWAVGDFAMSAHGRTDTDGLANVLGVRPGWVQLSASADGYTEYTGAWIQVAPPLEGPLSLQLSPSRRVSGRVVHDGDPIERFKVVWWTAQSILSSMSWEVEFADRQDGTFELESAPRERVWLMASADGFSRSNFVRSDVGSEDEILLELLPSCRA